MATLVMVLQLKSKLHLLHMEPCNTKQTVEPWPSGTDDEMAMHFLVFMEALHVSSTKPSCVPFDLTQFYRIWKYASQPPPSIFKACSFKTAKHTEQSPDLTGIGVACAAVKSGEDVSWG